VSDILTDARTWLDTLRRLENIGTHGEECHRWHLACLVSRLADEIARLREERRWVPVGERLPEDHRRVVVNVPSLFGPHVAWLVNGKWHDWIGCGDEPIGCRVTHWQPLPPGPEGEKPELPTE